MELLSGSQLGGLSGHETGPEVWGSFMGWGGVGCKRRDNIHPPLLGYPDGVVVVDGGESEGMLVRGKVWC